MITYQAGLPSVEECLQKAEQFCDENKFLEAMKYYLVSSSPELALDIGLNLVRGKIAGLGPSPASANSCILGRSWFKSSPMFVICHLVASCQLGLFCLHYLLVIA